MTAEEAVRAKYPYCEERSGELSGGDVAYGVFESPSLFAKMVSFGWWTSREEAWKSAVLPAE